MLFGFFQAGSVDHDEDIATGTYADGMVGPQSGDLSARPRERNRTLPRTAYERDYGMLRTAGQPGAGMVP